MHLVSLISWAFPFFVVAYLISIVVFVSKIQKEEKDYWQSIGSPGLWEPNGQAAILKRIFLPNQMPDSISQKYSAQVRLVRVFAFFSLLFFVSVLAMIFMGVFEPTA